MRFVFAFGLIAAVAAGCGSAHRGACSTTHGHSMTAPLLGQFVALGRPPVELDLGNAGDLLHGRAVLTRNLDFPGWFTLKTLWFTPPSFSGRLGVRVRRIDGHGRAGIGGQPPGGDFVGPAGPTANMSRGWRNFPSGTWVKTPGCYEWTISGRGFTERIVVQAKAPQ